MHLIACLLLCLSAYGGEKTKKLGVDLDGSPPTNAADIPALADLLERMLAAAQTG